MGRLLAPAHLLEVAAGGLDLLHHRFPSALEDAVDPAVDFENEPVPLEGARDWNFLPISLGPRCLEPLMRANRFQGRCEAEGFEIEISRAQAVLDQAAHGDAERALHGWSQAPVSVPRSPAAALR